MYKVRPFARREVRAAFAPSRQQLRFGLDCAERSSVEPPTLRCVRYSDTSNASVLTPRSETIDSNPFARPTEALRVACSDLPLHTSTGA
jgi:hypothetical protein